MAIPYILRTWGGEIPNSGKKYHTNVYVHTGIQTFGPSQMPLVTFNPVSRTRKRKLLAQSPSVGEL